MRTPGFSQSSNTNDGEENHNTDLTASYLLPGTSATPYSYRLQGLMPNSQLTDGLTHFSYSEKSHLEANESSLINPKVLIVLNVGIIIVDILVIIIFTTDPPPTLVHELIGYTMHFLLKDFPLQYINSIVQVRTSDTLGHICISNF